jgi:hypothetical protein
MSIATLRSTSKRQLKPLASPAGRFGLLGGGVEFGESDMVGVKTPEPREQENLHAVRG